MKFKKKKIKTRWHHQRIKDKFFHDAKKLGYRSRSTFKLLEINKKFRILKKGQNVLDLGSAPGGWSQIIVEKVFSKESKNVIVSVDLKEIKPIKNITFIKKDIFDKNFCSLLKNKFSDEFTVVTCDAAPSTTGNKSLDHIRIIDLCKRSFEISKKLLKKGGFLVIKIFDGNKTKEIINLIRTSFLEVNSFRPKSTKSGSKELYVVAKFFK